MKNSERRSFHNPLTLTNVGRCPSCGQRCQLPCAVCTHPRRVIERDRERLAELRKLEGGGQRAEGRERRAESGGQRAEGGQLSP